MWLQSSMSPHSVHNPLAGPFLLATYSLDGSRPQINCQRKTLIFGGTLVRHTSLKCVFAAPCDRQRLTDRAEKLPEASSAHDISSSTSENWQRSNSRQRLSHSTDSRRPKDLRNWMSQPCWFLAPATEMNELAQHPKSLGNLSLRGSGPVHQSSQKKVRFPL
jgi:hypothetical protein